MFNRAVSLVLLYFAHHHLTNKIVFVCQFSDWIQPYFISVSLIYLLVVTLVAGLVNGLLKQPWRSIALTTKLLSWTVIAASLGVVYLYLTAETSLLINFDCFKVVHLDLFHYNCQLAVNAVCQYFQSSTTIVEATACRTFNLVDHTNLTPFELTELLQQEAIKTSQDEFFEFILWWSYGYTFYEMMVILLFR